MTISIRLQKIFAYAPEAIKAGFITFMCLCVGFPLMLHAQNDMNKSNVLQINPTDDFEITGQGTNQAWEQVDWVKLNPLRNPGEVYDTQVKVLYSSQGIYFLFQCQDKVITSTLREDFADLYNEDVIEVFLWTDEAQPIYFEYELSPHNYELPILVPKISNSFMGWRPWHYEGDRRTRHATHIKKSNTGEVTGWSGEFFIPYQLMKPLNNVPPKPGTVWRANMYRIDYDKDTVWWAWQPIVNNFHDNELFGTFEFK